MKNQAFGTVRLSGWGDCHVEGDVTFDITKQVEDRHPSAFHASPDKRHYFIDMKFSGFFDRKIEGLSVNKEDAKALSQIFATIYQDLEQYDADVKIANEIYRKEKLNE